MTRKYKVNEDYFELIDSEEKAYWLGFIFADGCVSNGKSLIIELGIKDLDHLHKFRNAIECEIPISFPNGRNSCKLAIGSKKLVASLLTYGCHSNKSLTLEYPYNIKSEYDRRFIRGYFDGDGSLSRGEYSTVRKDRNNKVYHRVCWTFKLLGTLEFLSAVVEKLELPKNKIITEGSKAYQLKYGGINKPYEVISKLYDDCEVYMDRKLEKFETLKNSIEK